MKGFLLLITKPKQWLVDKVISEALKNAGDGEYGVWLKKVYWFIFSHALTWGVILTIADFGLKKAAAAGICTQCTDIDSTLLTVAGTLASLGVVVGFHAADAPDTPKPTSKGDSK